MFGVVFPERSYPIDASAFAQIGPLHWVLDVGALAPSYRDVREVCVFLLPSAAASLPPGKALAVYAQPPGRPFSFCGAVHPSRPSALLPLPWPQDDDADPAADPPADPSNGGGGGGGGAKIGVAVEDAAALPPATAAEEAAGRRAERVAMRVGENLFNYMQSFCGVDGSRLVVPMDILDRWFRKFQERARKDPSYLKTFLL
ncbi:Protein Hikeshi [Ananas comosus]|uniref:Protein Hikeshi n=1 Tax=Ananas comosus TaxID=4615 RepID=A0A199UFQ9_ANACO|nr:Protein Hikeshi [Ananas comosus]